MASVMTHKSSLTWPPERRTLLACPPSAPDTQYGMARIVRKLSLFPVPLAWAARIGSHRQG
jgi:hypothetical protein